MSNAEFSDSPLGPVAGVVSTHTDLSSDEVLDLTAGLTGLSNLVAGAGRLERLLTEVAGFTTQAIPGADGAGVTMFEAGRPDTIVASADFVRDVDNIQYRLGEGPCISAAATASTSVSGSLGEDKSWPAFGSRAAELDIHSALSLPLLVHREVIGALNVYAHTRNAFDETATLTGELFAAPAAVAVHNARVLDQLHRETARLSAALTSQATIDHAIGVLMARSGLDAHRAHQRLLMMSQQEHRAVRVVAERLVAQAVRRAEARASRPDLQR